MRCRPGYFLKTWICRISRISVAAKSAIHAGHCTNGAIHNIQSYVNSVMNPRVCVCVCVCVGGGGGGGGSLLLSESVGMRRPLDPFFHLKYTLWLGLQMSNILILLMGIIYFVLSYSPCVIFFLIFKFNHSFGVIFVKSGYSGWGYNSPRGNSGWGDYSPRRPLTPTCLRAKCLRPRVVCCYWSIQECQRHRRKLEVSQNMTDFLSVAPVIPNKQSIFR